MFTNYNEFLYKIFFVIPNPNMALLPFPGQQGRFQKAKTGSIGGLTGRGNAVIMAFFNKM